MRSAALLLAAAGENRIAWQNGCCEGDLIIIDFRDEQADGNDGQGMLYLNNSYPEAYRIQCARRPCDRPQTRRLLTRRSARKSPRRGQLGYMWKTFGPFCAPEGWHTFTYTSDANPEETTFTITDSYGLIKAQGGMNDFPVHFHTTSPNKFCTPDGGLDEEENVKRARKLFAYHDQFTPRAELEADGFQVPQDVYPPLTVWDNSGGQKTRDPRRLGTPEDSTATL